MENEMLVRTGTGIQPWQALEMSCGINPTPDCFYTPSWDASLDHTHGVQLDTGLGSIVSSPAASNSNNASENANVTGNSSTSLGQISPHTSHRLLPSPGFNSANTSLYSTPLSSLPNVSLPMMAGLNSSVAEFSADPGFAERAARFSCYGSRCRSFNGRSSHQMGSIGNLESPYVMNSPTRISRVLSSPSLKALGAGSHVTAQQTRNHNLQKPGDRPEVASSLEESSVSDQKDNGPKSLTYVNSRKRKAAQKGKAKESAGAAKVAEDKEDSNAKRCKPNGGNGNGNGNGPGKAEEDDKKGKNDGKKATEPPKDYIHVRARRGQATDSHSLAERVRREKISERMKLLQDLVPGCNKVVGKALMLDEIINYVRSLQRQVESLSMKLASVNTSMDFSVDDALMSNKDTFQSINSMPNPQMYALDSSAFHGQNISDGTVSHCPVDPLGMGTSRSLDAHLAPLNDLQYQSFCGGDLQTIVQMGFAQSSQQDSAYPLQPLHGSMQASQMKVEL